MKQPILGRMLRFAVAGGLAVAAIFVMALYPSPAAEARAFIGFGFGFPGVVGRPVYAPPPPPFVVYRPPVVYAPPPVVRLPAPAV